MNEPDVRRCLAVVGVEGEGHTNYARDYDMEDGHPDHQALANSADVAARRVLPRAAVPQILVLVVASALAVAGYVVTLWAALTTVAVLHGVVGWLGVGYAVALPIGGAVWAVAWARGLVGDVRGQRPDELWGYCPPTVTAFNSRESWVFRLAIAPMRVLGGMGLHRWGVPREWAVAFAVVAWAGLDLSDLATLPARRSLYRVTHLRWSTRPGDGVGPGNRELGP
jgi:hypothetical protein